MHMRNRIQNQRKRRRALLTCSLLALALVAASPGEPPRRNSDEEFALKAASAGQMVVALGRKARMQALDAGVKRYARRVVEDHRGAMDELRIAARGKRIPLMTAMTVSHQGAVNRLSRLRGARFDRMYIPQQVEAHRKAVTLFEEEIRSGHDPEFRRFAAAMLPTLRAHLRMARALEAEVEENPPD